ncbi:MAG: preprotein translocase subunit YajC [Peptostreptococcaceae bacterium]|nr:preprotein translocase subunit YajC [Peptostreptococcaceae bacterium]MDY5738985.1 preprotein translocase subunit YajC [Anaerovoracaceae bacterium]SFE08779.1 preprotein translocase subunit YajC [Peptostreptococcaceae bacterium pGA-8]
MNGNLGLNIAFLVVFLGVMYFLLIRPQRKKEKTITEMRNNIQVGDEIITIGGICGKVVKTKDETIVIMVGADRVKFELMRWSVSSVVSKSKSAKSAVSQDNDENKKIVPKRLKKAEADTEKAEAKVDAETDAIAAEEAKYE